MTPSPLKRDPTYRMPRDPKKRLKPGGPLKRKAKRMKAVSPKRAEQARLRKQEYRDSRGRSLAEVRLMLGENISLWPRIGEPIRDRRVCEQFHAIHDRCWFTGSPNPEAHHLGAGFTRGKRDELCCLVSLSKAWHERVNTVELPLGTLLWLKWVHDWPHVDWLRLTLIVGYHLPDLIPVELS